MKLSLAELKERLSRLFRGQPAIPADDLAQVRELVQLIVSELGTASAGGLYGVGDSTPFGAGLDVDEDRVKLAALITKLGREGYTKDQLAAVVYQHLASFDVELRRSYGLPARWNIREIWEWLYRPSPYVVEAGSE